MADTIQYSLTFFGIIIGLSCGVFALRASPLFRISGGLAGTSWPEWIGLVIRDGRLGGGEALYPRLVRLILVCTKYGACAWGLANPSMLTIPFWTLLWTALLALAVLRKAAQVYQPVRWEHLTLKLDDETFWYIHLILLGTAEIQIPSPIAGGLIFLVLTHIFIIGRSEASLLASFEDVVGVLLGLLALRSLFGSLNFSLDMPELFFALAILLPLRGIVRAGLGRDWLRYRFWWVAQFCLMTALIIKSLAVLNVFPFSHS